MISLRKVNVILLIIVILILLYHAILNVLGMYGLTPYTPDFAETGKLLACPLVLHIVISLYLFFKEKSRKFNAYPKLTKDTTQQFISGILIIFFVALHIISYMQLPPIEPHLPINRIHLIIDFLLFVSIAIHLRISIPKFLISLGFLEGRTSHENAKKLTTIIVMIALALSVVAEIIFYIGGIL